jgi:hypothetical protein
VPAVEPGKKVVDWPLEMMPFEVALYLGPLAVPLNVIVLLAPTATRPAAWAAAKPPEKVGVPMIVATEPGCPVWIEPAAAR